MKAWLSRLADLSAAPASPLELARFELSSALPDTVFSLTEDPSLGEGFRLQKEADGRYALTGGKESIQWQTKDNSIRNWRRKRR